VTGLAAGGRGGSRRLAAAAAVVPLGLALLPGEALGGDQTYYVPVTHSWTIVGHGFGHGHGMSQYGAQGAALQGLSARQIVDFYYPGTTWSKARGTVRVLISADWTSDVQVRARRGLSVKDLGDGSAWRLPSSTGLDRWRLTPGKDGRTVVQLHDSRGWHRWRIPGGRTAFAGDGQFQAPGPLTLMVPSGSDLVGRRYRGILRSVRPFRGATSRDTVNVLPLDDYVKGVVPDEMPASWAPQALRAQAVAARTYGAWLRAQNPKRYYQLCDTTSCQVYGGVGSEQASSNAAADATAGKILTYRRRPAFTQFSASSGGWTAAGGVPYLVAKKDPYDGWSGNGVHSWTAVVSTASLESAHPEIGRLVDLRVTSRDGHGEWRGRVQQIVLDGTRSDAYLTGDDFRWHYGLRSNWFSIEPTAIIARWKHLGGAKSAIGLPVTGEKALGSGSSQGFQHGRIFWSAATGARELRGVILRAYNRWGGPRSSLGWPRTGVLGAPGGGLKAKFQRGAVYRAPKGAGFVLYGPILHRWALAGAVGSWIGYPTTSVYKIDRGLRAKFQHAVITWDRKTRSFHIKKI
jgi:stage II sporulation protein D